MVYRSFCVVKQFPQVNAISVARMNETCATFRSLVQQMNDSELCRLGSVRMAQEVEHWHGKPRYPSSRPGLDIFWSVGINVNWATPTLIILFIFLTQKAI